MRVLIALSLSLLGLIGPAAAADGQTLSPEAARAQVVVHQIMQLHHQVSEGQATPSDLYRAFQRINVDALHGHVDTIPLAHIAASDPRLWRAALDLANAAIDHAADQTAQQAAIEAATRAQLVAGQRASQIERDLQRLRHDLSKELTRVQELREAASNHEREWMRAFRATSRNDGEVEAARQAFTETRTESEKAETLVHYLEDRVGALEHELKDIEQALEG